MRSRHRIRLQTPYLPQWRSDTLRDPLDLGPPSCPPASMRSPDRASRYELLARLASGGMATVYLGRLHGAAGFWRLCAIKRPHPFILEDPLSRRGLLEEARLASLLHHPNVVPIIDLEEDGAGRLSLVMDFVEGASLADLLVASTARREPLPARIAVRIALDVCAGLQAAHDLAAPTGEPLRLVHRDVSPQNVLVGVDGIARLADFGIAKHAGSCPLTVAGALKGKLAYMAPEYIQGRTADARSDLFALGVVIWEALANRRLFSAENPADTLRRILEEEAPRLSEVAPWLGSQLDGVIAGALEKSPGARVGSARALGEALEAAAQASGLVASHAEVGAAVRSLAREALAAQRRVIEDRLRADGPPPTRRSGSTRPGAGSAPPGPGPVVGPEATETCGAAAESAPTTRFRLR